MKSLYTLLKVRPEESTQVTLMLAMGFFMGIFIATYTVTAESLFLNQLSDQLDKAFLLAGTLGIVSTLIFSFAQARVRFTFLAMGSIFFVVLFSSVVYVLYHFGELWYREYVLFGMFILTGPMTAILFLCYWGIFGRLFDFRQSKRIIGWIDTGQLLAAILAFLVIPLTSNLVSDTSNYLVLCNISITASAICLITIAIKFDLTNNHPAALDVVTKRETGYGKIFKDKYLFLLSVFLVISMITAIFNQFAFQDTLNEQYPDQRELTNFLAWFNGTIYLLSLAMQTFINDKILGNYGIKISLFILPAIIAIFAVGSVFTGTFFGYNIEQAPTTFIFFFLTIALTRLFSASLRDALENPVFKLLFIPLDSRYRFGLQAKIEGVVNESGRFIAGLFIFLFALIPIFNIVWIPAFILLLVGGYFLVTSNLYRGYRNKIREKLETTEISQEKLEVGYSEVTAKLEKLLSNQDSTKAVFSFKLLEKINPSNLSVWANRLMKSEDEKTREYAQRRTNELKGLSVSDKYVIKTDKNGNGDSKNILSKSELAEVFRGGGDISKNRIQKLSRSGTKVDRQYAAELLLHSTGNENISFLIELLHDTSSKVRSTAILTSIKKHNDEVIYSLIDNLSHPKCGIQALNALVIIGGGHTLSFLDSTFYRSGQSTQTMLRVIQAIGRIGGQRAKDLLWNKIDFPDKVIVSQVLLSLGECGFKASISQITRIKYAIENDISDVVWNLNAFQYLGNDGNGKEIKKAIQREIQNDTQHLYMLLAMLYDTRSIQLVKENIESGTTEGTTYAIELLDVFLSDQLKQRVIPVLDDLTEAERLAKLEIFYPQIDFNEKLVLKFLINRDFSQANRWTKANVIKQIGILRISDFKLDLIAQMFNPDWLIKEIAAWSLLQIDEQEYRTNTVRLGEETQKHLNEVILDGSKLMLIDKVIFFKTLDVFEGMPGLGLSYIADISEEIKIGKGLTLPVDEKLNRFFYVVLKGSVNYHEKGEFITEFTDGQFVGEMLASPGFANSNLLVAKEESTLLRIDKEVFYELLSANVKLADKVLEYI